MNTFEGRRHYTIFPPTAALPEVLEAGLGRACPLGPEEGSVPQPRESHRTAVLGSSGGGERLQGPFTSWNGMAWLGLPQWERTQVSHWTPGALENKDKVEFPCVPSGRPTNVQRKPGLGGRAAGKPKHEELSLDPRLPRHTEPEHQGYASSLGSGDEVEARTSQGLAGAGAWGVQSTLLRIVHSQKQ